MGGPARKQPGWLNAALAVGYRRTALIGGVILAALVAWEVVAVLVFGVRGVLHAFLGDVQPRGRDQKVITGPVGAFLLAPCLIVGTAIYISRDARQRWLKGVGALLIVVLSVLSLDVATWPSAKAPPLTRQRDACRRLFYASNDAYADVRASVWAHDLGPWGRSTILLVEGVRNEILVERDEPTSGGTDWAGYCERQFGLKLRPGA